jgi:signal peptidase II
MLDQITKYIIVTNMQYEQIVQVINNFFYITFWKNNGAAWGILQGSRLFLMVVTIISLSFLWYLLMKNCDKLSRYAISMIIGGALGNFADRLLRDGEVIDFILFRFGRYSFPVFNVADILVVLGTGLFIVVMLRENESLKKNEKDDGIKKCC